MATPDNLQISSEVHEADALTGDIADQYFPENHPLVRANLVEILFSGLPVSQVAIIAGAVFCVKEDAEAGRRAEERFIATVSHEIRTPMNAVAGFIDLLSNTSLDQAQTEYVGSLQLSAQRR